jgi:ubiquinone biosynthesis protein
LAGGRLRWNRGDDAGGERLLCAAMTSIFRQIRRIKNLGRMSAIANAAVRHGFGLFMEEIGLTKSADRRQRRAASRATVGKRLRMLLEDLGPAFIKFGQAASARGDALPEEITRELSKLVDDVPPAGNEETFAVFESDLGAPPQDLLEDIAQDPCAAASMAQVYWARTKSGDDVVVKIQRPGIEKTIESDLDVLRQIAEEIEDHVPEARRYDPSGLVEEFADVIRDELNFTFEGHNCEAVAAAFDGDARAKFPAIHWELSSRRVLTMERLEGAKISDPAAIDKLGSGRRVLAERLAQVMLEQVFRHGVFHGDPHPGNVLVLPDGRIAFLDFGIVGRLTEAARTELTHLFLAIFSQDATRLVEALLTIGVVPDEADMEALGRDVNKILSKYYFASRSEVGIGALISRVMEIAFRHEIRLPSEFSLLGKALLVTEGTCLALDPGFDFNEAAKPYAKEMLHGHIAPAAAAAGVAAALSSVNKSLFAIPQQLSHVLRRLGRGSLRVQHRIDSLEESAHKVSAGLNRVAIAIVIGGVSVTAAMLLQVRVEPLVGGHSLLGLVGIAICAVASVWLFSSAVLGSRGPRRR